MHDARLRNQGAPTSFVLSSGRLGSVSIGTTPAVLADREIMPARRPMKERLLGKIKKDKYGCSCSLSRSAPPST